MTVLVVDEEIAIRDLLERALRSLGLEVVTAKNGIEAIELFQTHPISVALIDVGMNGLDGPETLKRLQALRSVACVFMTGGTAHTRDELLRLGACEVIRKPFGSFEGLVEVLQECFELAANHPQRPSDDDNTQAACADQEPGLRRGPRPRFSN